MMMLVPLLIFLGDHGLIYHQKNNKFPLEKMAYKQLHLFTFYL